MKTIEWTLICSCICISGCVSYVPVSPHFRIDEVPMYGGINRNAFPHLKEADEKYIASVSAFAGSRERGAVFVINQGFRYYREDQLGLAMRRFNQAWLLNPRNPEVYTGFAAVLSDQGEYCRAVEMVDKALSLDPPSFQGIYPDAGQTITRCAVNNGFLPEKDRAEMLNRAENLYRKGEEVEPNKIYLYNSWAWSYYLRERFGDARSMLNKVKQKGGEPDKKLLERITEAENKKGSKGDATVKPTAGS